MPLRWARPITRLTVSRPIMPLMGKALTSLEVSHPLQVQPLVLPDGRTRD